MDGELDVAARRGKAGLDENACIMVCSISSAMVGVCLTGIGLMGVIIRSQNRQTVADDLLSLNALGFLAATLASYFAIRTRSASRMHWLESISDGAFIGSIVLLTLNCVFITYFVNAPRF